MTSRTIRISFYAISNLALLVAITGCNAPQTHYYALKVTKPEPMANAKPLNAGSVVVERITGERVYDQERIVYRDVKNEVGFYEYHQWTSAPTEMTTQSIMNSLISGGYFRSVAYYRLVADPDYILTGRIISFEEIDRADGVFAAVRINVSLIDNKKGESVWSGFGESELPVEIKKASAVAERLDEALANSIKQINTNLGEFLKQKQ